MALIRFTRARPADVSRGLLGFLVIRLGDAVEIGGIALRRTQGGDHRLSFPTRRDNSGRRHRIARLIEPGMEEVVEAQILAELRVRGVLP